MTYTFQVRNGDYVLSKSTGRPVRLGEQPKASQAMARLLGTEAPVGAGIDSLIGTVPNSSFALSSEVQTNIRTAFARLLSIQRLNQAGARDIFERLASIANMFVQPAELTAGDISKTGYVLSVDVLTVAGETVNLQRSLVPPQG